MDRQSWAEYALLMIDAQRDFWPDAVAGTAPGLPAAVTRLLERCREAGIDVVHVRAEFRPDRSDWIARYRLRGNIPCVSGTPGAEPLPFAAERPGELVVRKQSFDAFLRADLDALLRARGKRFLFVAGLVTSTCVLFTAASATQLGYLVAVVRDCCADREGMHEQTLEAYPFVFSTTESASLLDDRAGWDRQLARLSA
ncbi:MAG TPA: isochorismatase family cysteine hydrolase [Actinophytocola sp.]|uniref:cysteine hydrolase family protein n=1 Tax=Actinophytocola sp. TaxID=1872138 RepID=UPI002DDDBB34|nr:isochorismatase family cysteine hydrolase [Actinophytocola sp.]HEV2782031.1 isochorismatase family cysteine hydrolase [Actinophytocola sp.]